ncbi:MAG: polysaccharide biosynthesis/export family protein [Pseudomonadota bacterium]
MTAACDLPRSGPNLDEVLSGAKTEGGEVNVVLVSQDIAKAAHQHEARGFSKHFLNAARPSTETIKPGDVLSITVWENVDNGLLATAGQKVTLLDGIQVDEAGRIFVPYAGRIEASGRSPEQLRQQVTRLLGDQTPDPQVEVRRKPGDGTSVRVIGKVALQGVKPLQPSTRSLTALLAASGGATTDPDLTRVTVRRGSQEGSVLMSDLLGNGAYDIALRPNDTIVVEEEKRSFTALGATTTQALVPFPKAEITLVEALAQAGGLSGNTADPTGIFVFRREPGRVADRVLGVQGSADGQPFAYVVDLTQPGGFFIAREFQVQDGDTIYITEAPFVGWARVIEATSSTLNFGTTLINLADLAQDS